MRKENLLTKLGDTNSRVLNEILRDAKDDGTWISQASSRELICTRLGIVDITLKQYIKKLYEKNILIKEEGSARGVYRVNPSLIQKAPKG